LLYNPFVPQNQVKRVQQDLERTLQALKATTDPSERKALLREMRGLIDEADRLAGKSSD
jgi:flagellin-like hook-associated protein FlgL